MKLIKIILALNLFLTFLSCSKDELTEHKNPIVDPKNPFVDVGHVPKTTTNEITDVSIYSFRISGKLLELGDKPVTELGFVVGTSSMPTLNNNINKAISQADNNGIFFMTYQGLPSNTTLYIRSYAINSIGVGYGNEIIFNTLTDKIYNGDITLTSQQEVINFGKNNYTTINGSLYINGGGINDLTPLNSLIIINNAFQVINTNLINFNGLNNLKTTGNIFPNGFKISNNQLLENFSGLDNLEKTRGDFYVANNSSLVSLVGLTKYKYASAGELRIANCNNLTSLAGLENLEFIGDNLFLQYNEALSNISALSNLNYISRRIYIQGNNSLPNLIGLEKTTNLEGIFVDSNNNLSSLNGLNNLATTEIIDIDNNNNLTDLSALSKIIKVDYLNIKNNKSLLNLQGLNNITEIVNNLEVRNNLSLINFNGLSNLTKVGYLYIHSNNSLINLTGLNALNTITGDAYSITIGYNPNLNSLTGLENLINSTGYIQIFNNNSLNNFCGLKNLLSSSLNFSLNISSNLTNPNRQYIVSNCN